jgi:hypothetical protein
VIVVVAMNRLCHHSECCDKYLPEFGSRPIIDPSGSICKGRVESSSSLCIECVECEQFGVYSSVVWSTESLLHTAKCSFSPSRPLRLPGAHLVMSNTESTLIICCVRETAAGKPESFPP